MQKKKTRPKTLIIFGSRSNFLGKSDKNVKFDKSVRLGLESMKKDLAEISAIPAPLETPLSSNNLKKTVFFYVLGSPSAKISLFGRKFRCAHFGPCSLKKRIFRSLAPLGTSNGA